MQQIIKAPPFFLEWIWPSEDGFFLLIDSKNMSQRVTFYIDGFNFYYGLRRTKRNEPQWGDYYWIDMVKLCEVVRGKYLDKQIQCPNCHYAISRPEEKKTDVNISVRMIADCVLDATDTVVLVSADSDLVPPLEFIQRYYPDKRIKVYFPPSNFSCDLKDNMLHHSSKPVLMQKNERRFRDAIMPDVVTDGIKRYNCPEKWEPANFVR